MSDIAEMARNDPKAYEVMISGLHELQSKVMKEVDKNLKRKMGDNLVGADGDGGDVVSSGFDGLDRSAKAKRLKPRVCRRRRHR